MSKDQLMLKDLSVLLEESFFTQNKSLKISKMISISNKIKEFHKLLTHSKEVAKPKQDELKILIYLGQLCKNRHNTMKTRNLVKRKQTL